MRDIGGSGLEYYLRGTFLASTDDPEALAQAMLRLMNLSKGLVDVRASSYIGPTLPDQVVDMWEALYQEMLCERYSGGMKLMIQMNKLFLLFINSQKKLSNCLTACCSEVPHIDGYRNFFKRDPTKVYS